MRRLVLLLAGVVMALTLIAVAAGVSAAAPKQQQEEFYGATYGSYGDSTSPPNKVFFRTGTTKAAAIKAANNACLAVAKQCQGELWVYNGWLAFAQGKTSVSFGAGRTKQQAANFALNGCRSWDTGCKMGETWETAFDSNKETLSGEV
jgi:hypothetical protein